jgi:hypothetical protein
MGLSRLLGLRRIRLAARLTGLSSWLLCGGLISR